VVADKGGPLAEDYYGFIAGSAYLVAALATVVPCSMRCGAAMQVWPCLARHYNTAV
jgi:hypothetical protein